MANGQYIFKKFFKGKDIVHLKQKATLSSLAFMGVNEFQNLLANIEYIEILADLCEEEIYANFFEANPIKKWLLERAVYELSLYNMKITEPIVQNRA